MMKPNAKLASAVAVLVIGFTVVPSVAQRRARGGSVRYSNPWGGKVKATGGSVRGLAGGRIGGGKVKVKGPLGGSVKAVGGGVRGPAGGRIGGGRVKVKTPGGHEWTVRRGGIQGPNGRGVRGGSVKYSGPGGDVKVRGGAVRGPYGGVAVGRVKVKSSGRHVIVGPSTIYSLPFGYRVVTIRGGRYYHSGGYYYRQVYRSGRLAYVRVDIAP